MNTDAVTHLYRCSCGFEADEWDTMWAHVRVDYVPDPGVVLPHRVTFSGSARYQLDRQNLFPARSPSNMEQFDPKPNEPQDDDFYRSPSER